MLLVNIRISSCTCPSVVTCVPCLRSLSMEAKTLARIKANTHYDEDVRRRILCFSSSGSKLVC